MQRFGFAARLKPEMVETYLKLHADPWPGVLARLKSSHIQNYSIFHKQLPDGENLLFAYFEYTGTDFEADMAKVGQDEETLRWWDVCKPCFDPLEPLPSGEVWSVMDSIFLMEGGRKG